ncbi:MAG: hypothetical protein HQL56_12630 [Magnetococcales bacterium]|nr:hypothetical protein [Magnetococcales bacterium]
MKGRGDGGQVFPESRKEQTQHVLFTGQEVCLVAFKTDLVTRIFHEGDIYIISIQDIEGDIFIIFSKKQHPAIPFIFRPWGREGDIPERQMTDFRFQRVTVKQGVWHDQAHGFPIEVGEGGEGQFMVAPLDLFHPVQDGLGQGATGDVQEIAETGGEWNFIQRRNDEQS